MNHNRNLSSYVIQTQIIVETKKEFLKVAHHYRCCDDDDVCWKENSLSRHTFYWQICYIFVCRTINKYPSIYIFWATFMDSKTRSTRKIPQGEIYFDTRKDIKTFFFLLFCFHHFTHFYRSLSHTHSLTLDKRCWVRWKYACEGFFSLSLFLPRDVNLKNLKINLEKFSRVEKIHSPSVVHVV